MVSPESVYIVDGAWKLAGFGFAIHPHNLANPNVRASSRFPPPLPWHTLAQD